MPFKDSMLHDFAWQPALLSTGNNTSLGKRRGQSLVDIFKRPFSLRKSMTPPASPSSQIKLPTVASKDDAPAIKADESVTPALSGTQDLTTNTESEEPAPVPAPTVQPAPLAENGQSIEVFPLPLPPTPNVSLSAV